MNFGQRLKLLRMERDINQKELADRLGLARSTIAGYEAGFRSPDYPILEKIADYFGVSSDWLLGRSDSREAKNTASPIIPPAVMALINDPDVTMALQEVGELTEEEREGLLLHLQAVKLRREHNRRKAKEKGDGV